MPKFHFSHETHYRRTHGQWGTPTHRVWSAMHYRCRNRKATRFDRYGGRGITVCERWFSFQNFFEDMGERPPGMSIDRIDNDRGYEPGNCRWATAREQRANQSAPNLLRDEAGRYLAKTPPGGAKGVEIAGSDPVHPEITVP